MPSGPVVPYSAGQAGGRTKTIDRWRWAVSSYPFGTDGAVQIGINPDVRSGFSSVDVEGDAQREALDALISASAKRSAVFDIITAPTSVVVGPKA
jgi:hypothetical protein